MFLNFVYKHFFTPKIKKYIYLTTKTQIPLKLSIPCVKLSFGLTPKGGSKKNVKNFNPLHNNNS